MRRNSAASAVSLPRLHDHLTSPALRHPEGTLKVCDRLAFARRACHLASTLRRCPAGKGAAPLAVSLRSAPSTSSFSIALSSDRSATSFLSCVFSFSSAFQSLDRLLLRPAVFLPPAVVGRRTDFQLLADFLHALASGQ